MQQSTPCSIILTRSFTEGISRRDTEEKLKLQYPVYFALLILYAAVPNAVNLRQRRICFERKLRELHKLI